MKALRIILAAAALVLGGGAFAQSLPELGKASEITTGKLPDGISYYLISNPATPGFADFALVQPTRTDREGPRRDLVRLPHFQNRKPYDFLASNSIGYDSRGYIQHFRDATVFRFTDVPVSQPEISDSTLLMMFDIARSSKYEQALVVSGNIDIKAVTERIRILSMTLPRRAPAASKWNYTWRPQDDIVVTTATAPVGSILMHYRSPRTEQSLMNTIQPVMSKLLADELEIILSRRIRAAFTEYGLTLADFNVRYVSSSETAGDETFSISVHTDYARLEDALHITAGVLSTLDSEGATQDEVAFAKSVLAAAHSRDDDNYKMSNAEYLDKCISSYLYGSNLASYKAISSVYSRKLDPSLATELLNRFAAALFSSKRNLHLHVSAPVKPDETRMASVFAAGWEKGNNAVGEVPTAQDTLKLLNPRHKVKLKNTSTDAFSGGKMWTFSNGVNVIFKKTSDKGAFHFGFMVKGGWGDIPDIAGSEPFFARDVLNLCRVGGMSSAYFHDLLTMYGITLEPELTLSDVRFTGTAPSQSLSLVLKSMLTMANNSSPAKNSYKRYLDEKHIRLVRDKFSENGTRAVLDSIACPTYAFATGSVPNNPGDGFESRIWLYLNMKANGFKNGLIVLVGDLDEAGTQKMLCHYLGELKTGNQRVIRPKISYPMRKCWSTNYVQRNWRKHGVSVSLSAFQPFGAEGNQRLQLACTVLKSELDKELAKDGMHCTVNGQADLLPAEMVSVYIHCVPVPASGLPDGVAPGIPVRALQTVRKVINRLATEELDTKTLDRCKAMLTNRYKAEDSNPSKVRDAVLNRNAIGRDMRSGYAQRINSVTPYEIKDLFLTLLDCNCEYVVQ